MLTIGTAGHVDHGKSTLVKRLTDIDPDRLKEEKQRSLTIDLGFAWFDLNGETVGVVDVPGHRDFIENMLAGVGGIDAVLLVIAADEGVMPQTREHLAIVDLLGVQNGLVVLTKTDLAPDAEWLDLVETDIRATLQNTALHDAEIVRVSALKGHGIPVLLDKLGHLLAALPPRPDTAQPALPVDRVFTIKGFGTVVTGTLSGGTLSVGDAVELQPGGLRGRVRGLQSYEQTLETAQPGTRTAINIAGIDRDAVMRGQLVTYPGTVRPSQLIDVHYRHLPDAPDVLRHNAEAKAFIGAAQAMAHVRLLDVEELAPGMSGFLQLRLTEPVAVLRESRFILRDPTQRTTIGGGVVLNPNAGGRYKRFRQDTLTRLEQQLEGTPSVRVMLAAEGREVVAWADLKQRTGLPDPALEEAITAAANDGTLLIFDNGGYLAQSSYERLQTGLLDTLQAYHAANPLRLGMPLEELRNRARLNDTTFDLLLRHTPEIVRTEDGVHVRHQAHAVVFTAKQQERSRALFAAMDAQPFAPPSFAEALDIVQDEALFHALIDNGELVRLAPDVIFRTSAYREMAGIVTGMLEAGEEVTVKSVRDALGTSRKYVLALLEHMDSTGVTRRVGDQRVLR
jgi:selenocysteine-specific elongation factor